MASNREQILANIHAFQRRCNGPRRLSEDEAAFLIAKWDQLEEAKDIEGALALIMAVELYIDSGHLPIPATWQAALQRFIDLLKLPRKEGCGYDFNQILLSHPFDGTDYCVTKDAEGNVISDTRTPCPNCGNLISWRAATETCDDD